MLPSNSRCVHDVQVISQRVYELWQLLWRVPKVVIHRDGNIILCNSDPGQKRVVLAVISHNAKAANPRFFRRQLLNSLPGAITAAIVDQNKLEGSASGPQDFFQPLGQRLKHLGAIVSGNNDRNSCCGVFFH
jgi:hypothetical protein